MKTEALELLAEDNPDVLKADGLDDGIIGHAMHLGRMVLVYDYWECVKIFMNRDGMDVEEAKDWMVYNVVDGAGSGSPVFVHLEPA